MVVVNQELLAWAKGPAAWNRAQLALLGLPWPEPKGWQKRVLGLEISDAAAQQLVLYGQTAPEVGVHYDPVPVQGEPFEDGPKPKTNPTLELGVNFDEVSKVRELEAEVLRLKGLLGDVDRAVTRAKATEEKLQGLLEGASRLCRKVETILSSHNGLAPCRHSDCDRHARDGLETALVEWRNSVGETARALSRYR